MKKKTRQKLWNLIVEPVIKGAVIFSIFGIGVYAYAIAYPTPLPNTISGVVGKFVGLSINNAGAPYFFKKDAGDLLPGSYDNVNKAACADHYGTNAHVCSTSEMLHNMSNKNPLMLTQSGSAYINGGSPGYYAPLQDCNAWSSDSVLDLARFWSFTDDYGKMSTCAAGNAFACCI